MFKKFTAVVLSTAILLTCLMIPASAQAVTTSDTPSPAYKAKVEKAIQNGFVPESLQGKYQQKITREEFCSLFVQRAFAVQQIEHRPVYRDESGNLIHAWLRCDYAVYRDEFLSHVKVLDFNYKDTQSEDVKIAYAMGLIGGEGDYFRPNDPITKQEMAVMFSNYGSINSCDVESKKTWDAWVKRLTDLNKAAPWTRDALVLDYYRGIFGNPDDQCNMKKKITISPQATYSREQAIALMEEQTENYCELRYENIYLRGRVHFSADAVVTQFEVSKDTVTAVRFDDIMKDYYNIGTGDSEMSWLVYGYRSRFKDYKNITPEAAYAAFPDFYTYLAVGVPEEYWPEIVTGQHHKYDFGYATYETCSPNFIFQFKFKNNGFYTMYVYGGSQFKEIKFNRIY